MYFTDSQRISMNIKWGKEEKHKISWTWRLKLSDSKNTYILDTTTALGTTAVEEGGNDAKR